MAEIPRFARDDNTISRSKWREQAAGGSQLSLHFSPKRPLSLSSNPVFLEKFKNN